MTASCADRAIITAGALHRVSVVRSDDTQGGAAVALSALFRTCRLKGCATAQLRIRSKLLA
jgi:malic enzyme